MRQTFIHSAAINQITKLEGDPLNALAGAAEITTIVGKLPVWCDLCTYFGTSKPALSATINVAISNAWNNGSGPLAEWFGDYHDRDIPLKRTEAIYALAAMLVLENYSIGTIPDSDELQLARKFLRNFIRPQQIQTRSTFSGMLMILEYLEWRNREHSITLTSFINRRFGSSKENMRRVNQFLALVDKENCRRLIDADCAGRRIYFEARRFAAMA